METHRVSQCKALLPIISGIVLCLTLPPIDISFFVWVALVPLLFYISITESSKKVFWVGFLTGTIYAVKVLYPLSTLNSWWWTNPSGLLWNLRSEILVFFLFIVALYSGGLFFGLFSVLFKKCKRSPVVNMLLFPSIWVIFELVREPLVLGFTWGHLGYALHDSLYVAQIASFGLVYGLSFIIVSINIGIFEIFDSTHTHLLKTRDAKGGLKPLLRHILRLPVFYFLTTLIVSILLFGTYSISKNKQHSRTLRVAAIHMDIKTEDSRGVEAFNAYLSLIDDALSHNPDLIVLPENTFPFFVIDQHTMLPLKYESTSSNIGKLFDELREHSLKHPKAAFIIGAHSTVTSTVHNSIIVLENGSTTDIYDKRRLMPFAEDASILFGNETTKPFTKGDHNETVHALGLHITPLICSEIIFPLLSRHKSNDLIVNASNDSVFDSKLVGLQNHYVAQIRAIENKKFLIRSVKGGITSIIDPFGRTVVKKSGSRGVIVTDIAF